MLQRKNETFFACACAYETARLVLFGAPYDSTASFRPGTRFAPKAMRGDSYSLETYSPYQDKDLADSLFFDSGDLELPFGSAERALPMIRKCAATILADGKLPLMIGGEHLVSLGAIQAAHELFADLHVLHFDAHTDLRDSYLGEKLSHATVIRRVWDILGDGRIWQFGMRSGEREEFAWAARHTSLHKFTFAGLDEAIEQLRGKPVYFTLDLDVLDPGYLPGTGTPEAGGVDFPTLLQAINRIATLNIVGCDMVELCPPCDQSGASTALALKLLRELLISLDNFEA
ncbi:MAG: agmatinase [Clostridiales bacterium]|nr:agmatinase [Clostridiales bacterium]